MKKKITVILILIVLLIGFLVLRSQSKIINYSLENKNYRLLIAKTPQEWQKGLMFYRQLKEADGMIFIFPDKRLRSFWNKNTYLDLDIYWLDDDKVAGKSFLPSIEKSKKIVVVNSPAPVDRVIEIIK